MEKCACRIDNQFLAGWRNAEQSVTTDTGPVRAYIRARAHDELPTWDVLLAGKKTGDADPVLGGPIIPVSRSVDLRDLKDEFMTFSGKGMRLASRGIEKAGVAPEKAEQAETEYRKSKNKEPNENVNFPDNIYRVSRDRGLFILHLVKAKAPTGKENDKNVDLIPSQPVIGWGISLPVSARPAERVEYVVNTVRYKELFGEADEDEDQEAEYE